MWQDYVFSVGSIFFIAALYPAMRSSHKPPALTSALTGSILMIEALLCYTTLHLWWTFATTLVCGSQWLVIAAQKFAQR